MKMSLIKYFEKELKKYCEQNSLSFEKICSFPRCGSEDVLFVQRVNREKKVSVINKPAEILISVFKDSNGKVMIEKGKNADKYLKL